LHHDDSWSTDEPLQDIFCRRGYYFCDYHTAGQVDDCCEGPGGGTISYPRYRALDGQEQWNRDGVTYQQHEVASRCLKLCSGPILTAQMYPGNQCHHEKLHAHHCIFFHKSMLSVRIIVTYHQCLYVTAMSGTINSALNHSHFSFNRWLGPLSR